VATVAARGGSGAGTQRGRAEAPGGLAPKQPADLERKRIEKNCQSEEAKLKELDAAGAAARHPLSRCVGVPLSAPSETSRPLIEWPFAFACLTISRAGPIDGP
jgi:hypothetical protein